MSWFWWLLMVIVLVFWVLSLVDIVRRRHERSKASSFAWALIVIIFPVLGTFAYLLVNGTASSRIGDAPS
jgi:hypothetical protein